MKTLLRPLTLCVLLSGLIARDCHEDTTPAELVPLRHSKESRTLPLLPDIEVTQLERWLELDLDFTRHAGLPGRNVFVQTKNLHIIECSREWSVLGGISIVDWPRKFTHNPMKIFALNGKTKVIFMQFREVYPEPFLLQKDRVADLVYELGIRSRYAEYMYHGRRHQTGESPSVLKALEDMIQSDCALLTHGDHEIGYQCSNFAISYVSSFFFDTMNWGVDEGSSDAHIVGRAADPDTMIKSLHPPPLPIPVAHESCDGCYGSELIIYQDIETLHRLAKAVREDFETTECLQ